MLYLQHTKKRKFMKQSLLSFLFAIVSILTFGTTLNAAETTVTFTPSDFKDGENQELNLTKDGVTLAVSLANITSNQIRVIKSQTLTVSSSTTITKIEFTCTAKMPLNTVLVALRWRSPRDLILILERWVRGKAP